MTDADLRILPCGDAGVLVELGSLDDVLALYAALVDEPPHGVVDLVPASRTLLLHLDPARTTPQHVERAVREVSPEYGHRPAGDTVEIPVVYDGEDLEAVGELTGLGVDELLRRHGEEEWTVAFCGFAPGFAYMVGSAYEWQVPRRSTPRTSVPAGSVGLAGEFAGIYPRESPGGWQLVGTTEVKTFDLHRDPPALLPPGTRVRFVNVGSGP